MGVYVGSLVLQNRRRVYRDGDTYRVVHTDGKGVDHTYAIPSKAIERLVALAKGEMVSADEAAHRLRPYATALDLQYQYGWKLDHLAREICVVLVTTGRAHAFKEGRRWLFRIL